MAQHPPSPGEAWSAVVAVDVANVLGSRPDGWWRDRAGATARLLQGVARVADDAGGRWVVVLEGRAQDVEVPAPLRPVRVARDGDSALVAHVVALLGEGDVVAADVLVVTADRGLRARLPDGVAVTGPGALRAAADGASSSE